MKASATVREKEALIIEVLNARTDPVHAHRVQRRQAGVRASGATAAETSAVPPEVEVV